jgi:dihydrodipicolinate synthase/N-acetylneuraminate lyase
MIKDACKVMGVDMGVCRRPLKSLSADDMTRLEAALKTAGQL